MIFNVGGFKYKKLNLSKNYYIKLLKISNKIKSKILLYKLYCV